MMFEAKITIWLKEGMLDPEAMAIQHALGNLGFSTENLRSRRVFLIRFDAESAADADGKARAMVERLLANPIIHQYEIEVAR